MSKYAELGEFLKRQRGERVPLTFSDIERITGATLPPSAMKHRPWWSNNATNSVLTKVWLDAGFKSEDVDMAERKLVFRRTAVPRDQSTTEPALSPKPFHPLFGMMKGLVRVMRGADLTKPADPEWGERLDAQRGAENKGR